MTTFKELIMKFPSRQTDPTLPQTTDLDPIVRHYNNYWGVATNTHCCSFEDGYLITGSYVGNKKEWFETAIRSMYIQAVAMPSTWVEVMEKHGLVGAFIEHNGQTAYKMTKVNNSGQPQQG